MDDNAPLLALIVGMSRGGTTWLSRCLGKHSQLAVFGESLYFGRKYVKPQSDGNYSNAQIAVIKKRLKFKGILRHGVGSFRHLTVDNIAEVLDKALPDHSEGLTPGQVFLKICDAVSQTEKKQWVIEKTPHHLNSIELILKYFPGLKIIAMYREPYGFMLSYKHQLDRQRLDRKVKRERQKMYHPLGCALVWKKYYDRILQVNKKYSKQVLCVDLSEIKKSEEKVLTSVQNFLGVPHEKSLSSPHKNTSFPRGEKPQLTSADHFWLKLVVGKRIIKFSPFMENVKVDASEIFKSIVALPIWGFVTLRNMDKEIEGNVFLYLSNWLKRDKLRIGKKD